MAQLYQVQVGDNVSSIAKRFGVQPGAITGYKSNNPNVIFPGESLTINTPVVAPAPAPAAPVAPGAPVAPQGPQITPDGTALVPPNTPPQGTVAPASPIPAQNGQTPAPVAPGAFPIAPDRPGAPVAPTGGTPATPEPQTPAVRTFQTPSGATVDEKGNLVSAPVESGLDAILQELANTDPQQADALMSALGYSNAPTQVLQRYGLSPQALEQGFSTNPTGTLSEMVQQVAQMTGLPDVRKNLEDIGKQIEDLNLQRDEEVQKINDNPFTSASTKQQLIEQVTDKYEKRIGYRTDRLTLLQNAYSQARQEAQFAVSTAVGLYDKNRQYTQDQLKLYLDQVEKAQSAQSKLGFELSPGQVRYQYNPKTGGYEQIAALPSATTATLGNLTKDERTYLNQIQDNARQDPNVKEFPPIRASFETARSAALKKNGAGDIVLMRMIAKITDPTTGVKEEEFRTFESAQSTLSKFGISLTTKMWSGDRLSDSGRLQLYQQAKDIYQQRLAAYQSVVDFFDKQATDAGLPSGLVTPVYTAPSSNTTKDTGGGWF